MKRSKKSLITVAASVVLVFSMCLTSYATPKTMPDGTIFDAEYYAQNNPDVVALVGDSEEALWSHYENYGKAEGRKPTADSAAEIITIPAVQPGNAGVIKISKQEALSYFDKYKPGSYYGFTDESDVTHGGGFDSARYAADYPEIAAKVGTSHKALWKHYKEHGYDEGRTAYYIEINDDENYLNKLNYGRSAVLKTARSICNSNMTDMEKARAVYDFMRSYAQYDYDGYNKMWTDTNVAFNTQNSYGFFKYKKVVCGGYTNTYNEFMKVLGIPYETQVKYINGESHLYSTITVNGQKITVDVTSGIFG